MRQDIDREFEAALNRLSSGVGGLVLVGGESGIGKTALLQRVLANGRKREFQVLYGRGEEMESTRPFRPIVEALRSHQPTHGLAAQLASGAIVPSDRLVTETAFVAADHLAGSMESLALQGPVLLALDDMQWADAVSVHTVAGVVRRLRGSAVLIIVAARDIHRFNELEAMADTSIELQRLEPNEVNDWVRKVAPEQPDEQLIAAFNQCQGLPLELARTLRNSDVVVRDGRTVLTSADGQELPIETRNALRIASLLGQRFMISELSELLDQTVANTVLAITPAVSIGLVDDDRDALRFAHPSDRATLELEIPMAARQAVHLQIATVIERHGGDIGRILAHLMASGPLPLDMSSWAVNIARQQSSIAPGPAAGIFATALSVVVDGDEHDHLNADLAEALFRSGQHEAANLHASAVLPGCMNFAASIRLRTVLYIGLDRSGRGVERLAMVDAELPTSSGPLRRWLLAKRANALLSIGRVGEAQTAAVEACQLGYAAGDSVVEILGQVTLGWVAAAQGNISDGISACQRAMTIEYEFGERVDQVEMYLGTVLSEADRFTEADAVIRAGRDRDLGIGDVECLSHYQWVLAGMALFRDDHDSAEVEARTGIDLAVENLNRIGLLLGYAQVTLACFFKGDIEQARISCAEAEEQLRTGGPTPGVDFHFWATALIAEADGDAATALNLLTLWWEFLEDMRYFLSWRVICPDLVRLAVQQGQTDLAQAVTDCAFEGARRAGSEVTSAMGAALRCQAWLKGDTDLLQEAIALLVASPRRLDERLAVADTLALSSWLSRATSMSPQKTRPKRAADELTAAELRIVRELSNGLSNREIAENLQLSRHTVESHLKRIFVKRGVRSRSALSALAVKSGWAVEAPASQ